MIFLYCDNYMVQEINYKEVDLYRKNPKPTVMDSHSSYTDSLRHHRGGVISFLVQNHATLSRGAEYRVTVLKSFDVFENDVMVVSALVCGVCITAVIVVVNIT